MPHSFCLSCAARRHRSGQSHADQPGICTRAAEVHAYLPDAKSVHNLQPGFQKTGVRSGFGHLLGNNALRHHELHVAGTGTLKGDAIKLKLAATEQMPIAFEFTGTVAGNKMSGTREIKGAGGAAGPGGAGGPGGRAGGPDDGQMDMSQISKDWTADKK